MELTRQRIEMIIKPVLWGYQIDPYEFYELAIGRRKRIGLFTPERALLRLLERLNWYELLELFGMEFLRKKLTKSLIANIHNAHLRRKYEFIRKILQGETVSFSRWGSAPHQRTEHTLLSNRWYRTKSPLF